MTKSKERVLFEGFKLIGKKHVSNNKGVVVGIGFKNGVHQTIEDLCLEDLTLTDNALKLLGL